MRELNFNSTTNSRTLSAAIAKEVVLKINSTLVERKTLLSRVSHESLIALTKRVDELIGDVSLKMTSLEMPVKEPTVQQVKPAFPFPRSFISP